MVRDRGLRTLALNETSMELQWEKVNTSRLKGKEYRCDHKGDHCHGRRSLDKFKGWVWFLRAGKLEKGRTQRSLWKEAWGGRRRLAAEKKGSRGGGGFMEKNNKRKGPTILLSDTKGGGVRLGAALGWG